MTHSLLDTKKINLPMKIIQKSDHEFLIISSVESLKIIASEETLEEAMTTAKSALLFTLFDLYKNNEVFPEVTPQELLTLEQQKAANETIILIETDLKEIIQTFEN